MKKSSLIATATLAIATVSLPVSTLKATDYTWLGGTSAFRSTNWSPTPGGNGPDLAAAGNTATINSGTTLWNGGDFALNNGNTFTINSGATWNQDIGNNYMFIGQNGGATLNVSGGTFDAGLASGFFFGNTGNASAAVLNVSNGGVFSLTNAGFNLDGGSSATFGGSSATLKSIIMNAGSSVSFTNGTTTINSGDFALTDANLSISGSSTVVNWNGASNEFRPGGSTTMSMSGGQLNLAGLFAFQGSQIFTLSGGAITLNSNAHGGFYGGGYFDFTLNSQGVMNFANIANAEDKIFSGNIRINGQTYNAGNYLSAFNVTHLSPTSTQISLITAVPEPSTYAAFIGLGCVALIIFRRRKMAVQS